MTEELKSALEKNENDRHLIKEGEENERHSSSSKLFHTYEKEVNIRKASGCVD